MPASTIRRSQLNRLSFAGKSARRGGPYAGLVWLRIVGLAERCANGLFVATSQFPEQPGRGESALVHASSRNRCGSERACVAEGDFQLPARQLTPSARERDLAAPVRLPEAL